LSGGYLMMTAISAAIAILGLLLSSPAVVIGAMLLSPLMGPILALGFAFWTVDWQATRRAVLALVIGLGLALLVSMALVAVSPLKEPTAEILARSRPTLFDLLVAIFSGVAGGYAVVRQRGEAVIGVAIATALMPPLATVGFGLSTGAWGIAGGAILLFFTNLIAIALAAAAVAALSGFRPRQESGRAWLHHAAVVAVLILLCIPLTLSLRTIALESHATSLARAEVARMFGPKARIASLSVRGDGRGISIEGLVATPKTATDADARLQRNLEAQLKSKIRVRLDQLVLADPSRLAPTPAPAPGGSPPPDPLVELRAAVPFPSATIMSSDDGSAEVRLAAGDGLDLQGARALEEGLRRRAAFRDVSVVPPLQPLPPVMVLDHGRKSPPTLTDASLQAWALARWGAGALEGRICRSGARPRLDDLQAPLEAAFQPERVHLVTADRASCLRVGAPMPFVIVSQGPMAVPASSSTGAPAP
jgi:uncharacterized hydrophobic protein (TIGR00271 family)